MSKILRITAKRAGFRRAGIAHPDTPTDHPLDGFTPEQVKALKAESMLVVQELDGKAKLEKAPKAPAPQDNAPKGLEREKAIADAVRGLDPENASLFTKAGEPKLEAIEEATGFTISGDERDGAWATVQAEREAAAKEG